MDEELNVGEWFLEKMFEYSNVIEEVTFISKINLQMENEKVNLAEDSWSATEIRVKFK